MKYFEEFFSHDRLGCAPEGDLAVTVATLRQGARTGREYRLAAAPGHVVIQILGPDAIVGPNVGILGEARIQLSALELPSLAAVTRAWREIRIGWSALTGGWGRLQPRPRRYQASAWEPQCLRAGEIGMAAERDIHARRATANEHVGTSPVEIVLENGVGQRVGVVVRTGNDRCVTMVRGSIALSARWPVRQVDHVAAAELLLHHVTRRHGSDRDGPLRHLQQAAELDAVGMAVLEQAARDIDLGASL